MGQSGFSLIRVGLEPYNWKILQLVLFRLPITLCPYPILYPYPPPPPALIFPVYPYSDTGVSKAYVFE